MRKLLLIPIMFFTVLFFSACGVEEQFKTDANLETFEGILIEQKNTDAVKGTHFIDPDESKEKIPVRSLSINLSATDYLNNKVKIIGFYNDDGVFEVTGISVLEVLSQNNLKNELVVYKNSEFGFELNYYNNWKFNETVDSVIFSNSDSNAKVSVTQSVFKYSPVNEEDQNSVSALKSYFSQTNNGEIDSLINKIGIDGYDVVKIEDQTDVEYTLYRTGFIYIIKFSPGAKTDIKDDLAFKQMLASFKFIGFDGIESALTDGQEVSDKSPLPSLNMELTSFESLPFKFSGKYPNDWYYAGSKSQSSEVLHHYGFGKESVTSENEIIALDVLAGSIPTGGEKMAFDGKEFSIFESGETYTVYVSVDGQNYRLSSDDEYKDLILVMAGNISNVEEAE